MAMLNKNISTFIFFISILIGQNTKPTVAILDFEGQGVDASEVLTLSERMRTEIGNTNAVRLIERKAVEKIMMEQGLQQSGCTTDECAAEVGQLLGVQFMISGSIGKMGKSYTIDCKMFSVETGETVRTKSATHKGDVSGLLTEMEILAWEIVGLNAPQKLKLKRAGTDATRTVAVLDFEGRGITMQEAQTLTDRFTTSLSSTNKVVMVERGTMNDVLQEQGFDAGECTSDECAAEVGAMLGVEYMISGSIGKIGNAYTIDAKMFSVSTGAAESMKSITYAGAVEGLIIEIEILAWDILSLDPPRALKRKRNQGIPDYSAAGAKRKTKTGALLRSMVVPGFGQLYSGRKLSAYSFMGIELALIGLAYNSQSTFNSLQSDQDAARALYDASTSQADIEKYAAQVVAIDADLQAANDQLALFSSSAAGLWAINVIHAFITGPKDDLASLPITVAYDPVIKQTRLQWTVDF
jgi:TolB-like protein